MTIRNLEENDIKALSELYYQFWNEPSDIERMKETFARLRNDDAYILLCASENEKLVGSVTGIVCKDLYGTCKPYLLIENMVVDSDSRKKGIGKALFTEMEKRAKERGCTQIILVTEAERKDACAFYESMGFHPTSHRGYKKKIKP